MLKTLNNRNWEVSEPVSALSNVCVTREWWEWSRVCLMLMEFWGILWHKYGTAGLCCNSWGSRALFQVICHMWSARAHVSSYSKSSIVFVTMWLRVCACALKSVAKDADLSTYDASRVRSTPIIALTMSNVIVNRWYMLCRTVCVPVWAFWNVSLTSEWYKLFAMDTEEIWTHTTLQDWDPGLSVH